MILVQSHLQPLNGNNDCSMTIIKRLTFSLIFLAIVGVSYAQKSNPDEARFNNARELMELGKYGLAMQAFEPLTTVFEGNRYAKISSFYYGVCAFKNKQKYVARDMFLQILQKYPTWEKLDEVNLWLANIYLIDGDFQNGLNYASFIRNPEINDQASKLKTNLLSSLTYEELDSLLKVYPSDKAIAENLADKIIAQPIGQQDRGFLENIVSVYELDKIKYRIEENLRSVKKDKYQVAIMLPFMLDELRNSTKHLTNDFVIELYEGILIGTSELKSRGINISLHLYDTQRDSVKTSAVTKLEELKHMDLIIGPLYPGPVKVVSEFAFANQINMVNPLSNNSEIIGNNPFAFLFMPSNEVIAEKSAEFISDQVENRNTFIFHGQNDRDSALAYAYKNEIERNDFNVCLIESIAKEDGKKILDILTNTISIEFDASEFDSVIVDDRVEGNLRITEKDYLVIQPDSIGHVYVASNDPALVANAITGLETRGDTIALLGSERWLDQRVISIGGLDRLNTYLAAPGFFEKSNPKLESLNTLYMESFNSYPSRYFYTGYEVMMTMGKMLGKLGNLYQFDPGINEFIPGELFTGTLFGSENCNQVVPIIQFNRSELVKVKSR